MVNCRSCGGQEFSVPQSMVRSAFCTVCVTTVTPEQADRIRRDIANEAYRLCHSSPTLYSVRVSSMPAPA